MKNLFLWYLPQAAFFGIGSWFGAQVSDTTPLAVILTGVMLAAAYTGGANLLISISARLRRHRAKPGADGKSLAAGGRLTSQSTQERQRVRIGQDSR